LWSYPPPTVLLDRVIKRANVFDARPDASLIMQARGIFLVGPAWPTRQLLLAISACVSASPSSGSSGRILLGMQIAKARAASEITGDAMASHNEM